MLRDYSDTGFIVVVRLVNALIGTVQQYGAERSAQALRALTVPRAMVLRDGQTHEVAAAELVPGDVVVVEAGGKVPADLRRLRDAGIAVDESLLTGESVLVSKSAVAPLPPGTAVAERKNLAFAGTLLTRGRAQGVVVATGQKTQLGRIATSISATESQRPPLLLHMDRFRQRIALAVGVAVVVLGGVALLRGNPISSVFLLAVALAVAAIPEGLPVALTVALSIGARRCPRCRALVPGSRSRPKDRGAALGAAPPGRACLRCRAALCRDAARRGGGPVCGRQRRRRAPAADVFDDGRAGWRGTDRRRRSARASA